MSEHGNATTDDVAAAKAEYEEVVFQTEWGYTPTSKAADKVIAALEALVDAQAGQLAAARTALEPFKHLTFMEWQAIYLVLGTERAHHIHGLMRASWGTESTTDTEHSEVES